MYEKIKKFFKKFWKLIVGIISAVVIFMLGRRSANGSRVPDAGSEIRESRKITEELGRENKQLGEQIDSSRERLDESKRIAGELREENTELGNTLSDCRDILHKAKARSEHKAD